MLTLSLIVQCLCFVYVTDGESTKFTVYFHRNGGDEEAPFLVTANDLTNGFEALSMRLKKEVPIVMLPQSSTENWSEYRIYNSHGRYLESTQELVKYEQKKLYLVPRNRYFVWPHVQPGHRVLATDRNTADGPIMIESLSTQPRIFFLHNLFTKEEANFLIERALTTKDGPNALIRSTTGTKPREQRNMSDEISVDAERTSDNAWDQQSPTAMTIIKRIFDIVRVPFSYDQADGLQLVRYHQKNAYRQHHDYFPQGSFGTHNFDPASGGTNRFATIFLYLNDVEEGGQTVFSSAKVLPDAQLNQLDPRTIDLLSSHKKADDVLPKLEELFKPNSWQTTMVNECYKTLSVKPKLGTAVLFYSMSPDWKVDPSSLHGGCPVLNGTKWGANMWIWNGPRYDAANAPQIPASSPSNTLTVQFHNTFKDIGKLFWKDMELAILGPDQISHHNTHDTHTFRFEINDVPVWTHTMDVTQGWDQQYDIGPKKGFGEHSEL